MKYPRYTKKQDARCKLSKNDIKAIQVMYEQGIKREDLASRYKVSISAIRYWVDDEYRRKTIKGNAKREIAWQENNKELALAKKRKAKRKKRETQREEIILYRRGNYKKKINPH